MLGASMFLLCGCWSVGVELVGLVGPLVHLAAGRLVGWAGPLLRAGWAVHVQLLGCFPTFRAVAGGGVALAWLDVGALGVG